MADFGTLAQGYITQVTPVTATATPADSFMQNVIAGGEILGAGGAMAYLNARSPAEGKTYHESFGYPTDALGAGLGLVIGFIMLMSGSKSAGGHVLRVGLGCLAETGIRMAFEKGVEDRQGSQGTKQMTGAATKPQLRAVPHQATSMVVEKTASESPFQQVR